MQHHLQALKLFTRVAHTNSFSKTAREAGLAQSSVSRTIAELEKEVGVQLLLRTTRAVTLTDAGRTYLGRIEAILDALDAANHAARGTGELRGVLRVGAPLGLGIRELVPALPAFLESHPALRLHLIVDDQWRDMVRDGVDVLLRAGKAAPAGAISRRLATLPRVLVAAPSYLARAGTPVTPGALAQHRLIAGPVGGGVNSWSFTRNGKTTVVPIEGRISVNVNEAAVAAAVAGLGILSTGLFGARRELETGTLVQLLAGWTLGSAEFHAILPAGRAAKPAARAFLDFLLRRQAFGSGGI